jgi:WD40 repeat protein
VKARLTLLATALSLVVRAAAGADPPPDAAGGRLLAKLPGPAGTDVAFSRDGKLILTAGGDEARGWDAETYKPVTKPLKHSAGAKLFLAALSPDGKDVLTVAAREALVWDAAKGERRAVVRHASDVRSGSFSPDGSKIITASEDGAVRISDTAGAEVKTLKHPGAVKFAAFSPDGAKVVTVTVPNEADAQRNLEKHFFYDANATTTRVWDAETGRELFSRADENVAQVDAARWRNTVAFSADGTKAVSAMVWLAVVWGTDGRGAVSGVDTRSEVLGWQHGWPEAVAISPDGSRFAVCGNSGVSVWPVKGRLREKKDMLGSFGVRGITDINFSPDGKRLLLAGGWGNSGVYELGLGLVLPLAGGHGDEVPAVAFSPDGKRVAAGFASDGFTGIWQVPEPNQP